MEEDDGCGCGCLIGCLIIWLLVGLALCLNDLTLFQGIGWLMLVSPFVGFAYIGIIAIPKKAFEKAEKGSEKDIDVLINSVVDNSFGSCYRAKLLTKLKSSQAINLFCQRWIKERQEKLTKILLQAGYVATQPDDLRVLTALKVNKIQACLDQNPKLIRWLLAAFEDQDMEISSRAKQYAICLSNQSAIDELFSLFVKKNNQIAYQCIEQAKYQSTNINYKALFHFLRDEWDAYDELDFDQAILQKLYQSVSSELRKTIAEKARKRGWTEWLRVAKKSRKKMTPKEWEITISILKNNRELAKMWQLVKESPIWVAQKLLVVLSQGSYQPSSASDAFYQPLLLLANRCPTIKIAEVNPENKSQLLFSAEEKYTRISPDGQFLVTSDLRSYGAEHENPKVWRIADSQLLLSARRYYEEISLDWQFLVTSELGFFYDSHLGSDYPEYENREYKNPKVWRIADGKLLFSAQGKYKGISPDGQFLVTSDYHSKVWRIADGKLLFSAQEKCERISPDWQFLVTSDDYDHKNPKVWKIADGKLLFSAQGKYYEAISSDWQFLITYDREYKNTKVWRITDSALLFSAEGKYNGISLDGQFLVTYDYDHKNTKVWRIADGKLFCFAKEQYEAISPDGQFLVTYDYDHKNTKVWRIANGKLLCSAEGEYNGISLDGQFLVTYDYKDKNTKVWRIDLVNIQSYFLHKFTDQLTIQDINLLQDLRKNPVSNYVYPMVTDEQKPWLDLIIKLAEYRLSFDVDITEDK